MALKIQLGDMVGITDPHTKVEKIYDILAFRQNPKDRSQWQIQLRNVRGTKKFWEPATILYSSIARQIIPIHRR